ncbi:hypothetical protein F5146DRAFT_1138885 [Armillaria mellea]|nr:hypothetical protein F5146DRAFT_1138885 [Armillaria mellea]
MSITFPSKKKNLKSKPSLEICSFRVHYATDVLIEKSKYLVFPSRTEEFLYYHYQHNSSPGEVRFCLVVNTNDINTGMDLLHLVVIMRQRGRAWRDEVVISGNGAKYASDGGDDGGDAREDDRTRQLIRRSTSLLRYIERVTKVAAGGRDDSCAEDVSRPYCRTLSLRLPLIALLGSLSALAMIFHLCTMAYSTSAYYPSTSTLQDRVVLNPTELGIPWISTSVSGYMDSEIIQSHQHAPFTMDFLEVRFEGETPGVLKPRIFDYVVHGADQKVLLDNLIRVLGTSKGMERQFRSF